MKKFIFSCLTGLTLMSVQACTSTSENEVIRTNSSSNADGSMPKEFEGRFSIEGIKAEREAFYAQKRRELRRLSVVAEVNAAIRSNNIHLMAVPSGTGGSRSFPGLLEPQLQTVNCNIKFVESMGDVLYGKNHALYRQELLNYMRRFNALMAPYCK